VGDPAAVGQEKIDAETLMRIADITGGRFFEAEDHGELEKAHQDIMALEPEEYETIVFSPKKSLHHYCLGAIIVLYTVFFAAFFILERIRKTRTADDF
jgi:Ca-activated chloride channel family protein